MKPHLIPALIAFAAATPGLQAQAITNNSDQLEQRLSDWQLEHGSSWHMTVNAETGFAEFLFGGSMEPSFTPQGDADYFLLAREALDASYAMHAVDLATLSEDRTMILPLSRVGTTDKMSVRFTQSLDGVPVYAGSTNVLFDTEGHLLAIQTTAIPDLSLETTPAQASDQAIRRAFELFQADAGLEPTFVGTPELYISSLQTEQSNAALTWRVDVQWVVPGSDPVGYTYVIDAADGRLVSREDSIHFLDVGGTVSTMATPGSGPDAVTPEVQRPAGYVTVFSNQGTATADADGNFNFPGVNNLTGVTVGYEGSWADVNNDTGSNYILNVGNLSGTGNSLLMNPASTDTVTSQANALIGLNHFRDWVRSINPADNSLDASWAANTNLASTCNAFYDGGSTNYYLAGGGCVNTSYASVVAHEQGHWANDLYNTFNGNDGMGEGNGDMWSMYQYDTPVIGEDFFTSGGFIRTGLNTRPWCGSGCYGQVHTDGEVWMGAGWKIRRNLKNSLGTSLGGDTANALFLGWMNGFDQSQIQPIIEEQWLTLDDDDANIDNGTPNYNDINDAFLEQAFPGFELSLLTVANLTQVPNTTDQAGPYVVNANIDALVAPPITSAVLNYSVNGGAFVPVTMSFLGGSNYGATIPGQPAPSTVRYYVTATDSASNSESAPEGAPAESLFFLVGEQTVIFADNMQFDTGWAVQDIGLSTGSWERADPQGTAAQPENDNPVGGDTLCYVTDGTAGTGVGSFDVDDGPTRLISPIFDMDFQDGFISYYYWMYNDDGDDSLTVEVSNNGGSSWTPVTAYQGGGGGWVQDQFLVSQYVVPSDQIRVRFSVEDNPNDSITEAAIDDFVVEVNGPTGPACDATNYCTAVPNSTGNPGTMSTSGSTSIAANNLTLAAFDLPPSFNGLFVYSPDQTETPLGNGNLCVGSSTLGFVLRLDPVTIDIFGLVSYPFDNTNLPPSGDVAPGETWYFQLWHRDDGGEFFNFSDGTEITFCP